jgi:plastocyanin
MRRLLLMFLMLGLLAFAAGCGDDDDEDGGGTDEPAQEETSTAAEEPQKLEISISSPEEGQFEYEVPETVEAGLTEIEFTNEDEVPHEAQLIRLEGEDADVDEFLESTDEEGAPIPEFAVDGGGVGSTAPGETATATQVLQPGRYLLFDSETPEGEGEGEPNHQNGARVEFEITGEEVEAELPETEASIVADEYSFETDGLKAGENELTFENAGEELHHVIAFPFTNDEATIEQLEELFQSEEEPEGPPPVDFEKAVGTAVIDGGISQNVTLELESGRYAFVCFIPDREGGPPHVAKGMIAEVEIP